MNNAVVAAVVLALGVQCAPVYAQTAPSGGDTGSGTGGGEVRPKQDSGGAGQGQKSGGSSGNGEAQGQKMKPEAGKPETQGQKMKPEPGKAETQGQKMKPEAGKAEGGEQNHKDEAGAKSSAHVNVQIRPEQRTKITQTVRTLGVRPVTNIGVRVAVGTIIPRHVELRPLPREIIDLVPEFRAYEFFVTANEIVIVDPARFEIVEIIAF